MVLLPGNRKPVEEVTDINAEGHRKKADELWHAIQKLVSEPEEDVIAIVELAFGMCHHLIACGMERKFGHHIDAHIGGLTPPERTWGDRYCERI